jgi:WhiB family transcriptional regulator, redox-sensing transcriptional regulator
VPAPSFPNTDSLPCHALDPDTFFSRSPSDVAAAKRACTCCFLRQECLGRALRDAEPWGIWGGETLLDGAVVAELRLPGRPPKSRIA